LRCFDDFNLYGSYSGEMGVRYGFSEMSSSSSVDDYYSFQGDFCGNYIARKVLTADSEPDMFYINIPDYSSAFILNRENGVIFFDQSKRINLTYIKYPDKVEFHVFNNDGSEYIFKEQEITENFHGNNSLETGEIDNSPQDLESPGDGAKFNSIVNRYISTWYLSKIITPSKREIIFEYIPESYISPTQESCIKKNVSTPIDQLPSQYLQQNPRYSRSKSKYENVRLYKIIWDEGVIEFTSDNRDDLIGYSSVNSPKKLFKINIYNKLNSLIKSFGFNYSYFNDQNWGNYNYLYKRLKLISVQEFDKTGHVVSPPFAFNYFEGDLIRKNSNDVDLWGFQNGKTYGKIYYPAYWVGSNNVFDGADRSSNFNFLKIGTLNQIYYPTGGKVSFEYELNDFIGSPYASTYHLTEGGGLRIKRIVSDSKTREYKYKGGKLIITPTNIYNQTVNTYECIGESMVDYNFPYIAQCSNSVKSLSSIKQGVSVGYNEVSELVIDGQKSLTTIYNYYNEAEEPNELPYLPNKPIFSNGLIDRIDYISSDNNGRNQQFQYETQVIGEVNAFIDDSQAREINLLSYNLEWWKKKGELSTDTLNGEIIVKSIDYKYNNDTHLISEETSFFSDGNVYVRKFTYPSDYSDIVSIGMKNKNMVANPIEKITLKNGSVISAIKTEYKQFSEGVFLPNTIYKAEIDNPIISSNFSSSFYKPILNFNKYNLKGQIVQIKGKDNIPITYLWGYNYSYPIAEIKNATFSDVLFALNLDEFQVDQITSDLNPDIQDLRNKLLENFNGNNVFFTTFTYNPLVGILTAMDSRGIVKKYSYDDANRLEYVFDNKNFKTNSFIYNYRH
jgi:hypothetical protein